MSPEDAFTKRTVDPELETFWKEVAYAVSLVETSTTTEITVERANKQARVKPIPKNKILIEISPVIDNTRIPL